MFGLFNNSSKTTSTGNLNDDWRVKTYVSGNQKPIDPAVAATNWEAQKKKHGIQ